MSAQWWLDHSILLYFSLSSPPSPCPLSLLLYLFFLLLLLLFSLSLFLFCTFLSATPPPAAPPPHTDQGLFGVLVMWLRQLVVLLYVDFFFFLHYVAIFTILIYTSIVHKIRYFRTVMHEIGNIESVSLSSTHTLIS